MMEVATQIGYILVYLLLLGVVQLGWTLILSLTR